MSNWSFIKHVTDYLTRPSLSEQKAPTLWPSSATAEVNGKVLGKCRRQAFFRYAYDNYLFSEKYEKFKNLYKLIKTEKLPTSTYSQWIFIQGDLYEDYCVNLAKESGVFIGTQISIYVPKYNISGKIDLIVVNPSTMKKHIVEVKSVYGFNANSVLGTDAQQRKGIMGEPRESHLMQLGIYQWWSGNVHEDFGEGLLVYGSRDTGRYGEYLVTVETNPEDNLDYIHYQGIAPVSAQKFNSGITIQSILSNYKLLADCLEDCKIPNRDYYLKYSDQRIKDMYEAGELGKVDSAQYEKRLEQEKQGKARLVKKVEKGDWQCRLCEYRNICYDKDSNPKEIDVF